MQRERPTAVLVIAIFNFILGGLGLIGSVCGGGGIALLAALGSQAGPAGPPGQPNPFAEMAGMYNSIPGFIPYTLVTTLLGSVFCILLLVAGIGLLGMKPWARWICIIYAIYTILGTGVGLIYTATVVTPAVEAWQKDFAKRMGGAAQPTPGFNEVTMVCSAVLGVAYGVVLLIVLNLPHVRAAFSAAPRADEPDFPDEDSRERYGRRRRREEDEEDEDDRFRGE
jgi:hypothetical protein